MRYQLYAFKFSTTPLNGLTYAKAVIRYCMHDCVNNTYFNIERNKWLRGFANECWYSDLNDLMAAVKENLSDDKMFECKFNHNTN